MLMPLQWMGAALALMLSTSLSSVTAQDLCACTPSVYSIMLNFSNVCPPAGFGNATGGLGQVTCDITAIAQGENTNVTSMTPVSVTRVDYIELGPDFNVIAQAESVGTVEDGDIVSYTSITALGGEKPAALQMSATGQNLDGVTIVSKFTVEFTNSCDAYPVIVPGDNAGWFVFVELVPPRQELCPAVAPPVTTAPTPAGTAPSIAPVPTTSPAPTGAMSMSMSYSMSMRYLMNTDGMIGLFDDLTDFEGFQHERNLPEINANVVLPPRSKVKRNRRLLRIR